MYDPELVDWGEERKDIQVISVPATQVASEIGAKLSANMVILGFLQQVTEMFKQEDLYAAIHENVKERFVEVNLKAAGRGIGSGQTTRVTCGGLVDEAPGVSSKKDTCRIWDSGAAGRLNRIRQSMSRKFRFPLFSRLRFPQGDAERQVPFESSEEKLKQPP